MKRFVLSCIVLGGFVVAASPVLADHCYPSYRNYGHHGHRSYYGGQHGGYYHSGYRTPYRSNYGYYGGRSRDYHRPHASFGYSRPGFSFYYSR